MEGDKQESKENNEQELTAINLENLKEAIKPIKVNASDEEQQVKAPYKVGSWALFWGWVAGLITMLAVIKLFFGG